MSAGVVEVAGPGAGTAVSAARVVVVDRPTEREVLLARHATRGQVAFFLAQRGRDLEELDEVAERQAEALATVLGGVPRELRRARVRRDDLDRFLFEPDDLVVVVGKDGLVANVAGTLRGQPVLGVDPSGGRRAGVLARHAPDAVAAVLAAVRAGTATIEQRRMVHARLDDGREMRALNEVFVGHRSHQSARYRLAVGGGAERQSSSGLIVATGTGATGWAASIHRERACGFDLPAPGEEALAWFVREAWPSPMTGCSLTAGRLGAREALRCTAECEGAVVFGDGIEADALVLEWGQTVEVGIARETLRFVA